MKILLADPPWYSLRGIRCSTVSLGLAVIGGSLEDQGHEVSIWNGDLYGGPERGPERIVERKSIGHTKSLNSHPAFKNFCEILRKFSPDLVGISCMTAEFFSAQCLAKLSKEDDPARPVVLGGVHASLVPEEVLRDPNIDYAVIGEGEKTIGELTSCLAGHKLRAVSEIRGLGYRFDGIFAINEARPLTDDLDGLPLPSYRGLIDWERHLPADLGGVLSSRGCPYFCTYCASHRLWTRKVRFRSVDRVLAEIRDLYRIGVRLFRMHDDAFTIHRERVVEFCRGVSAMKDIRWSCDTRAELLDGELMRLARRSGCVQINVGLESASGRIQSMINKRADFSRTDQMIREARRIGIRTTIYFMIGFPGETFEEIEMTVKAARRLRPSDCLFSLLTPYPGTEVWEALQKTGQLRTPVDYSEFHHHSAAMNYSRLSSAEFTDVLERIDGMCARIRLIQKLRHALYHPLLFFKDRSIIYRQLVCRFNESIAKIDR